MGVGNIHISIQDTLPPNHAGKVKKPTREETFPLEVKKRGNSLSTFGNYMVLDIGNLPFRVD